MDENIANFTAITSADPDRAAQYLQITDNNLEQAIALFFEGSNDLDLGGSNQAQSSATLPAQSAGTRPSNHNDEDIITIDSDDDMDFDAGTSAASRPPANVEDDEAMARRLQEEMYGSAGAGGDPEEVRAPMARTTETLVGGPGRWDDPDDLNAAVAEQMLARQRQLAQHSRAGIFNQRTVPSSVWDEEEGSASNGTRRRHLSRATGGASEASSKSNLLAEMYRPPFELICRLPWDQARDQGKSEEKWIIVNVQDSAIFDCQVLNRDIWKDAQIKDTIKENFLFMQYLKEDPQGQQYIQYYFPNRDSNDAYPHIAIVDPRTGEQVKVWSGSPIPKAPEFLMQLHEFLDRYSLKSHVRNPVATRKPEKKPVDVGRMTEEEMLEMALQNSLGASSGAGPRDEDPDELTKQPDASSKGKERAEAEPPAPEPSAFSKIPSDKPHDIPDNTPNSTRIQFRHPEGRTIHRFALAEPVQRIYEWLKASPLQGKEGVEFELIANGKNLIEALDTTIGDAGLKNGTVMVELLDS
ncbi:hypothetical protein EJ05DRAFT_499665 [Pseudovirgaria hyperparasitica]|uniref:UBX domain-containing protein n=1 Tax=Pseudovirgaria hyperparasitica TaxID=470096 RepID=A0A6A6WDR0_9PEZI|nr:uncharacterized protein EJ05DRAFT_499665 [Pseudovirgaria hyperparasitica]KAF2759251.1 hypothetical protein EJ05DRAFT_499665 [Pseudovirgaria hyperparasitica]